jgi:hypothetical protein
MGNETLGHLSSFQDANTLFQEQQNKDRTETEERSPKEITKQITEESVQRRRSEKIQG